MQTMIKPKLASAGIVVNTITWFLDVACGLFSYSFKYDFKTISKENTFERAKLIYLLNFNIYSKIKIMAWGFRIFEITEYERYEHPCSSHLKWHQNWVINVPLFWSRWNLKNSSSLRRIFHNFDLVSDIIDVLNFVPAKSFLNKHEWESKSYVQHFYIWDYVRHWTRNDHVCSPKSDLTFNLPFSALTDSNSPTAFN